MNLIGLVKSKNPISASKYFPNVCIIPTIIFTIIIFYYRISAAKPHSADVEHLTSVSNSLKSLLRSTT